MNTAQDVTDIITRFKDFVTGVSPFAASEHDTTEDLLALDTLLNGFSAPKDEIPDRGVIGLLRDLHVDVSGELHKRLEKDKVQLGDYELERKGPSYSNTWDHARAAEEVSIAALVDENGELRHESPVEAANTVANAILKTAGISYWRVTAGDQLGTDLRKFRDRGIQTSPAGVIVRKAKGEPPAPPGQSDPLLGDTTDTKGRKPGAPVLRPDPGIPEKKGTPSP